MLTPGAMIKILRNLICKRVVVCYQLGLRVALFLSLRSGDASIVPRRRLERHADLCMLRGRRVWPVRTRRHVQADLIGSLT
jgi:hypothetical protein